AGPMARTVADAAALLGPLTGVDPRDAATQRQQARRDYSHCLRTDGLSGRRVGVLRNYMGFDERVDACVEASIAAIREAGAEVVDPTDLPTRGRFGQPELEVLLYEFKDGLNAYLRTLGDTSPMKSLADVIAFNEANAGREMPYFGQDLFIEAQSKGPLTDKAYLEAKEKARRLSR